MVSLSGGGRAGVVDNFGTASRCFDGMLGIDNVCFGSVVGRVCPWELRLGGAGASEAGAAFLDLRLPISNGIVSAVVCDGRGGFGLGCQFPIFVWWYSSLCILRGLCLWARSFWWSIWPYCWLPRSRWVAKAS